jgi:S-adenosylmethionine synthetase
VIRKIGYTKSEYMFEANSCGIFSAIHEQSPDINQGVERKKKEDQGAGDQGMMFGYATNETDNYMPLPLELAHLLLRELAVLRREGKAIPYLRPDAKSQVTIEYSDDNKPQRIDAIVISTQHDDFGKDAVMLKKIKEDVINILIPRIKKKLPKRVQKLFNDDIKYFVNPTGKFVIGGPKKLEELVSFPFQIISQEWGMRPTTRDRKPIMGAHPEDPSVIIFNGLGTKGVSLSPYLSPNLVAWLEGETD